MKIGMARGTAGETGMAEAQQGKAAAVQAC